jgi:hypothetical protein
MARYSVGTGGTAVATRATGTPHLDIKAGANPITVYEIAMFAGTAVAWNLGVGRPANSGSVVQTTTFVPVPDTTGTPLARLGTAWSTAPTIPAVFMRNVGIASGIGNGYTFVFPDGILVPANGSLVVWNTSATPTSFNHVVFDE